MATNNTLGMMDPAYFVGRRELLDWINTSLGFNLSKIEQTASGAIACQLLHSLYPNDVPLHKVNWEARADYEYVCNYKVLQTSFDSLNISRHIDVDKLIKGKYQDNLEFMQWFKGFYDQNSPVEGYNPATARTKGKGSARANQIFGVAGKKKPGSEKVPPRRNPPGSVKKGTNPTKTRPVPASTTNKDKDNNKEDESPVTAKISPKRPPRNSPSPNIHNSTSSGSKGKKILPELPSENEEKLKKKCDDLESLTEELNTTVEALEKERNFYFDKLRDIEILLQAKKDDEDGENVTKSIFKILYATTDDFIQGGEDMTEIDTEFDETDVLYNGEEEEEEEEEENIEDETF